MKNEIEKRDSGYYPDEKTDDMLETLEKKIEKEYKRAADYVEKEAEQYFRKFRERFLQEYNAYLEGKYTDQEFYNWYYTQVGRGEGWEFLNNKLTERVCDANKVAAAYINDATPGIWSLNYNYEAYIFEKNYEFADFHMWDEPTVRRLMLNDEIKLPNIEPNYARDYLWNQKKMNSALISNILMGKGIDDLAGAFELVTNMNRTAAIRNARTAVTSAQNAGRMASYVQAEKMGIEVYKEWIATLDDRTRVSHAELDGKRVKYDEAFENGLYYPGDMSGAPRELYNCRCTMRAIMPGVNDSRDVDRIGREPSETDPLTDEEIKGQNTYFNGMTYKGTDETLSYEEWLGYKEQENAESEDDINNFDENSSTNEEENGIIKEIDSLEKPVTRDEIPVPIRNVDLSKYVGQPILEFDNQHIREWYVGNLDHINDLLDYDIPLMEQAEQAFNLRNQIKEEARANMEDIQMRDYLFANEKIKTFDELIEKKINEKDLTYVEALRDIVITSSKSREAANKMFGLELIGYE